MAAPVTGNARADADGGIGRIRLLDMELTDPVVTLDGLDGYDSARILVRAHGVPLGAIAVPVRRGVCSADDIEAALGAARMRALPQPPVTEPLEAWPSMTVAICTRARPADLAVSLAHVAALDYEPLEIIVVDNAPLDDATAAVCAAFPHVRRVVEPRPGLNHARNRAIAEARGELIAFIDDDAVADAGWAKALARRFVADPDVTAVTGLIVPWELETPAQIWFEQYGGFGCGYARRRFDWRTGARRHEVMECGTGANMAFRRSAFAQLGRFDGALDAGTATGGGGDIDMFFRVLREGGVLEYEPTALVRHMHRRDYTSLRTQITSWGTGMVAVFARNAGAYPGEGWPLLRLGARGFVRRTGDLIASLVRRPPYPRSLIAAELYGTLVGFARYRRARASAGPLADYTAASRDGD